MGLVRKVKQLVEMTDFFNSTQLLRYENQSDYRTFTGGVLSLGIIVTIIIGFASMILDTLNLSTFTYTQNVVTKTDPSSTVVTVSPESNFMFGIEIWNHNLSSQVRYFDVVLNFHINKPSGRSYTPINLEQCTKEHWASLPEVTRNYDVLNVSDWLCPPIGDSYELLGKFTSEQYNQLYVTVNPCNNETDPSRPCASVEETNQLFEENGDFFYFTFYYVNTVINPDQPIYKSYYLDQSAYVIFGQSMGVESYLQISDYTIQTDYSIWPFSNRVADSGFMSLSQATDHAYPVTESNGAQYVYFGVEKSSNSVYYARNVQKISTVFSFIGGLIGALMAALFVINSYTSFAYEISVAIDVFKKRQSPLEKKQGIQIEEQNHTFVNFIKFLQYYSYIIVSFFKEDYVNEKIQHLRECRNQILKQLDVKSLIKRIIFLQYSMTFLFSDFQLQGLQLHKPTNPLDVRAVRKRIDKVDLTEADSNQTVNLEDGKKSELLQPQSKFNIEVFLSPNKIANYDPQNQSPTSVNKSANFERECKDLVIENMSEISLHSIGKRQRYQFQKKKTTLITNLRNSAKEGNLLSKRIWDSIRIIEGPQCLRD